MSLVGFSEKQKITTTTLLNLYLLCLLSPLWILIVKSFFFKLISDESCIRFQVERVSLGDDYPIKRLYGLYVKLGVKVWSSACGLHHKKLLILRYW